MWFGIVAALVVAAVTACGAPVAFYKPGEGGVEPPVSLGGPGPRVTPVASPRDADPVQTPNVYAGAGKVVRRAPARLYVPDGSALRVLDQGTLRPVAWLPLPGAAAVVAGHDLRRLWTRDAAGLTPVDPRTGRAGQAVPTDGDTVYFAPDGSVALVPVPAERRVEIREPGTLRYRGAVRLPCAARAGDFTADGAGLVLACPAGAVVRVDAARSAVTARQRLPGARPAALRLAPDGRAFLVADRARGGVWTLDAATLRPARFTPTSPGARSLTLSRDARRVFVVGARSVVPLDLATGRPAPPWPLPGGLPAEAGDVTADGSLLWLASPTSGAVFALHTTTGEQIHRLPLGGHPRAPRIHPHPGHHSLGPGLYR